MRCIKTIPLVLCLISAGVWAADTGNAEVDKAYKEGKFEVDRGDPVQAMPKLKTAADGGHGEAQALYGFLLDQADDDAEAQKYYKKSADQGSPDGMFGLANFHVSGDGGTEINIAKARALYEKAANAGHRQSILVMFLAYTRGGLNLKPEDMQSKDALHWIKTAANTAGMDQAMERMAIVYAKGEFGIPVNPQESEAWLIKAMEAKGIDPNAKKKRRRQ